MHAATELFDPDYKKKKKPKILPSGTKPKTLMIPKEPQRERNYAIKLIPPNQSRKKSKQNQNFHLPGKNKKENPRFWVLRI